MQILQRNSKIDYSNNKQPVFKKANLTLRIKPTLKNIPENDQLKLKIPGPLLGRKYYNFSDNDNNKYGETAKITDAKKSEKESKTENSITLKKLSRPVADPLQIEKNQTNNQNQINHKKYQNKPHQPIPLIPAVKAHISILVLTTWGIIQDILRFFNLIPKCHGELKVPNDISEKNGFPNLYQSFDSFFTRNMYMRVRRCWNKPICSVPGRKVDLLERKAKCRDGWNWSFKLTGNVLKNRINLASYNYLGFAQNQGICADTSENVTKNVGLSTASSPLELGNNVIHKELEELTADFLGVEKAIIFGMGFATNSMNIPCLVDSKSLVISDQNNHSSIVTGCRLSGATINVFKHNDMRSLEKVLRNAVIYGNPKRVNRPYSKILIIVEGIYSMEGTICNLPEIVALKHKYKACLFVDEAHSIGALGKLGRGVCEYFGIDPNQRIFDPSTNKSSPNVDILMGTFTKSFGGAGGYIGGQKELINFILNNSHGCNYAISMPPPVVGQVYQALKLIGYSQEGQSKIKQLAENTKFFRTEMVKRGCYVFGDDDSPVVPMLTCELGKMIVFQDLCIKAGLAVVVVSFPATPLAQGRARFCLSASHTREDLEESIDKIERIVRELRLDYFQ